MTAGPIPLYPILAIHIADGVLTWPWLAGGFALAALLAAVAMIRVRDEEIPRIALMTAAFFIASLIHVSIGPTSVHLLLNGLLGVVIGRRAPLAVLIGIGLQFALFAHGGASTIGVNTCVMALPALGAAWLFGVLRAGSRRPWARGAMVAAAVSVWTLCLIYSVTLLWLGRNTRMDDGSWSAAAVAALGVPFNPFVLVAVGLLAGGAAVLERRLGHAAEFPAGLLTGMAAVLATLVLAAAVLLWGSTDDWHTTVLMVFVAHMPIAVVEGVILGFVVGFLARVKPEMLDRSAVGDWTRRRPAPSVAAAMNGAVTNGSPTAVMPAASKPPAPASVALPPPALFLLAVLGVLWAAAPARAHRLEADYRVRKDGRIQVESWFSEGDKAPAGAKIQVFRPNGDVLIEGAVDDKGIFVFAPKGAEDLKVVVSAGAGHRAEFVVPGSALPPTPTGSVKPTAAASDPPTAPPTPMIEHPFQVPYKEIVAGFGFLLGLAAFVLSLRNMRQLQELKRAQERMDRPAAPADDAHFSAGKTSSSGTSH